MSNVSRGVYQKTVEENKKLLADIEILTGVPSAERMACVIKWREKFNKEKEREKLIFKGVNSYIKKHEKELPNFITIK